MKNWRKKRVLMGYYGKCKNCKKNLGRNERKDYIKKTGYCKICTNIGEFNSTWKGDKVGHSALHNWVKRRLVKPQTCQDCNRVKPLDLANISQEYKRELSDWEWLCRKCHVTKDGRINKLLKGGGLAWTKTKCYFMGSRNPNWKGGITINMKQYNREYYQKTKSEKGMITR